MNKTLSLVASRALVVRGKTPLRWVMRFAVLLLVVGLLAGSAPGRADAAHGSPDLEALIFDVADDVVDTWEGALNGAGYDLDPLGVATYTGTIDTACGRVTEGDLGSYCATEGRVYFDLAGLAEIDAAFGEAGVAVVVADTIGYHVLTSLGIASSGLDRAAQASCLAGFWAWDAERDGNLDRAAIADAVRFYWATYDQGGLYAEAFFVGYETDDGANCLDVAASGSVY